MSHKVHLNRIELLPSGRLSLTLRDDPADAAKYIYRAAAEIQWIAKDHRFISPRPELGPPAKHFSHVAAAVKDECGYDLVLDASTEWINLTPEDRSAIETCRLSPGA